MERRESWYLRITPSNPDKDVAEHGRRYSTLDTSFFVDTCCATVHRLPFLVVVPSVRRQKCNVRRQKKPPE